MKRRNPFSRGGKDRGLLLIDGDNYRDMLRKYNRWPDIRQLIEWVDDPGNLGIDKLVEVVYFATVFDVNNPTFKEVPLKSFAPVGHAPITMVIEPYRWVSWATLSPQMKSKLRHRSNARQVNPVTGDVEVRIGIQDEAIFHGALSRIKSFDTLVCVSSDSDFVRFAEQLSSGSHPFLFHPRNLTTRRTIIIGSKINAKDGWEEEADELVEIEAILPQLSFLPNPEISVTA